MRDASRRSAGSSSDPRHRPASSGVRMPAGDVLRDLLPDFDVEENDTGDYDELLYPQSWHMSTAGREQDRPSRRWPGIVHRRDRDRDRISKPAQSQPSSGSADGWRAASSNASATPAKRSYDDGPAPHANTGDAGSDRGTPQQRREQLVAQLVAHDDLILRDPYDQDLRAQRQRLVDRLKAEDEAIAMSASSAAAPIPPATHIQGNAHTHTRTQGRHERQQSIGSGTGSGSASGPASATMSRGYSPPPRRDNYENGRDQYSAGGFGHGHGQGHGHDRQGHERQVSRVPPHLRQQQYDHEQSSPYASANGNGYPHGHAQAAHGRPPLPPQMPPSVPPSMPPGRGGWPGRGRGRGPDYASGTGPYGSDRYAQQYAHPYAGQHAHPYSGPHAHPYAGPHAHPHAQHHQYEHAHRGGQHGGHYDRPQHYEDRYHDRSYSGPSAVDDRRGALGAGAGSGGGGGSSSGSGNKTRFFLFPTTADAAWRIRCEGVVPAPTSRAAVRDIDAHLSRGGKVMAVLRSDTHKDWFLGYAEIEGVSGQGLAPSWLDKTHTGKPGAEAGEGEEERTWYPVNFLRPASCRGSLLLDAGGSIDLTSKGTSDDSEGVGDAQEIAYDRGSACLSLIKEHGRRCLNRADFADPAFAGVAGEVVPPDRSHTGTDAGDGGGDCDDVKDGGQMAELPLPVPADD